MHDVVLNLVSAHQL